MSRVLQLASRKFSLKNLFVQKYVNIQSYRDISKLKKTVISGSFVKRMRYESSRVFHIDYQNLTESNNFLTDDIPKGIVGGLRSYSLFFFLEFLYCRKQRTSFEAQSALKKLRNIVEEISDKSINMFSLFSSYTLLLKAFELSNDQEGYLTSFFSFLKAMKKSDNFEALMKYNENDVIK